MATPVDASAISALVQELSAGRTNTRYHTESQAPPPELLADLDPSRGVIAVVGTERERLVGVAAWHPSAQEQRAHAVLAVAEGWRQADVAPRLLADLGRTALRQGVLAFIAEIVPRNAALRAAARALGLREERDGGRVEIDLRPLLVP